MKQLYKGASAFYCPKKSIKHLLAVSIALAAASSGSAFARNDLAGSGISVTGDGNSAYGYNVKIKGNNSAAWGMDIEVDADNSITLGIGSTNNRDNTVSFGTADNNRQLTNIAAGTEATDAVNLQQVNEANAATLSQANSYTDAREIAIRNDLSAAGGNVTNLSNQVTNLDGRVSTVDNRVAGLEDDALQWDATANAFSADHGGTDPNKITSVAAGELSDTSVDAVNGSQLKATNDAVTSVDNRVSTVEGDITKIRNGADGMFKVNQTNSVVKPKASGVDSVAGGSGAEATGNNSVAIGTSAKASGENSVAVGANSVADRANTVAVGNAGNERQITSVAAGVEDTDAVNVAQLNKSVSGITGNANAYTDSRYASLKNDLHEQDNVLSAGIAGALAQASLPQPYVPGASMAAAGVGNYRGQSAVAVGVSRISNNGKWVTKLQGSADTQGHAGVSAGVGYQW
ncbi:Adhesin YadA precursor [compost metagenome]